MNFTDPEICINMKSIEVVNLVKRAPPESLPQSLKFISSEASPIFDKCDSDIEKPSQVIPKHICERCIGLLIDPESLALGSLSLGLKTKRRSILEIELLLPRPRKRSTS